MRQGRWLRDSLAATKKDITMNAKHLVVIAITLLLGGGILSQTDLFRGDEAGSNAPSSGSAPSSSSSASNLASSAPQSTQTTRASQEPTAAAATADQSQETQTDLASSASDPSVPEDDVVVASDAASASPQDTSADNDTETPTQTALADSALSSEPEVMSPEMDMLRVEPSGDALVSGRSAPNSIVALMNNGEVVGKTVANEAGDWVVVLDKPLEAGDHDLSVDAQETETSEPVSSNQRATVVINEDKTSEPLVIVTDPNAPSSIVSLPDQAVVPDEDPQATTDTADTSAEPSETAGQDGVSEIADAATDAATETADSLTETVGDLSEETAQADASASDEMTDAEAASQVVIADGSGSSDGSEPTSGSELADSAASPNPSAPDQSDGSETVVAKAAPLPTAKPNQAENPIKSDDVASNDTASETTPSADQAAEIETALATSETSTDASASGTMTATGEANDAGEQTTTIVVAPSTADDSTSADQPATAQDTVAEASDAPEPVNEAADTQVVVVQPAETPETTGAETGTETGTEIGTKTVAGTTSDAVKSAAEEANEPFVTIRSLGVRAGKLIAEGDAISGGVVQISVDGSEIGTLNISETEAWRFESDQELAVGPHVVEAALIQNGITVITVRETVTRDPNPLVTVEAVEVENNKLFVAGATLPNATVRVYVDNQLTGQAKAGGAGRWVLETTRELAPGEYQIRADQVEVATGTVLARAAVPFERIADEPVLLPVVTAAGASGASGSGASSAAGQVNAKRVIIRKGDNLWRISRRLYGRGVRFSTIYQANAQEIQNPNLIFPGQVFVLPEGDDRWNEDPVVEWENIRG